MNIAESLLKGLVKGFVAEFEKNRGLLDAFQKRITERQSYGLLLPAMSAMRGKPDFVLTECTFSGRGGTGRRIDYVVGYKGIVFLVEVKVCGASAKAKRRSQEDMRIRNAWDRKDSGVNKQLKNIKLSDKRLVEICRAYSARAICLMPILIVQYSESSSSQERLKTFGAEAKADLKHRHDSLVADEARRLSADLVSLQILADSCSVSQARVEGRFRCTRAFGFYASSTLKSLE